jgi:hypothetical protein
MTTATSVSRIRHDSDAMFQEWIQEMTTKLAACGLVQTADTGQINTGTATRPAPNTSAGYQIWRFDDALQSTVPVFIRFEYRSGGGTTIPTMFVGVGTSTDGLGTLTGLNFTPVVMGNSNSSQISDTLRNSYWCHTDGFFGMNWKVGAGNTEMLFGIARTANYTTGAATGDGLLVAKLGTTTFAIYAFKLTGTTSIIVETNVNSAQLCHWPMLTSSSSLVGLDPQVALAWIPLPRVTPVFGLVGVRDSEFLAHNTFTFTPIGSISHTYLALSSQFSYMCAASYLKAAMLWE